jgi:hypothetical protein
MRDVMRSTLITLLLLSPLLSACGSDVFSSDTKLFPSQVKFFSSQDWATATKSTGPDLIAVAPAPAEELVDANGHCGVAATQSDVAVGTVAGDLGTTSAAAQPAAPTVAGGIALGMSECQVVARAGQPGQLNIGVNPDNERKTVLTYNSGPWPGIYTFSAGRLKDIQAVAQVEQPKPAKKKLKTTRGATTASTR